MTNGYFWETVEIKKDHHRHLYCAHRFNKLSRLLWQTPQCTCPISHNTPFRTEMCKLLFWMVYCRIWDRCVMGCVRLVYCGSVLFYDRSWDFPRVVPREAPAENQGLLCKILILLRILAYIFLGLAVWAFSSVSQLTLLLAANHYGEGQVSIGATPTKLTHCPLGDLYTI